MKQIIATFAVGMLMGILATSFYGFNVYQQRLTSEVKKVVDIHEEKLNHIYELSSVYATLKDSRSEKHLLEAIGAKKHDLQSCKRFMRFCRNNNFSREDIKDMLYEHANNINSLDVAQIELSYLSTKLMFDKYVDDTYNLLDNFDEYAAANLDLHP